MKEEELKLGIVILKKSRKKVNRALAWKLYYTTLAILDVYLVCGGIKAYMDGEGIFNLFYSGLMTACYAMFVFLSGAQSQTIDDNLEDDILLEELLEEERLSK